MVVSAPSVRPRRIAQRLEFVNYLGWAEIAEGTFTIVRSEATSEVNYAS
jgi:hypothetical protein